MENTFIKLGTSHWPAEEHRLTVSNLHVHYGNICALADVNFSISCGHCVGLLGPNGAGKSTLVKSIAGLIPSMKGSLSWRGQSLSKVRQEIAYLPQTNTTDLKFPLTVGGLVELGRYPHLGALGAWSDHDSEMVEAALQTLGISNLRDRRLYQLSGGQKQRAEIARALAQEAHILLLDEPFAGLDDPSQRSLASLLKELSSQGRLIMVCHHDFKMVPELFDHVLLLNRKLIRFGPVEDTFTQELIRQAYEEPAPKVHV